MIAKLINFFLVYILTVVNFFVILMPLTFIIIFGFLLNKPEFNKIIYSLFFLSIAAITAIMLLFLFFNFMFSITVNGYKTRNSNSKNHPDYKELKKAFNSLKKKFGINNVDLLIEESNEINAFAVGSLRSNVVILTTGLIDRYKSKIKNEKNYILSLRAIMAHELSHIINKDYLCGLLVLINEKANNFVSKILYALFYLLIIIVRIIPFIGTNLANGIITIYNFLDATICFFYEKIFKNLYRFLELQISRNIEYRADKQASLACGGRCMSFALSFLGKSGFFTLFSTHPSTARRRKVIQNIEKTDKIIKPVAFSNIIFCLSFVLLIFVLHKSIEIADVQNVIHNYKQLYYTFNSISLKINYWFTTIKYSIKGLLNSIPILKL